MERGRETKRVVMVEGRGHGGPEIRGAVNWVLLNNAGSVEFGETVTARRPAVAPNRKRQANMKGEGASEIFILLSRPEPRRTDVM